MKKRYLFIRGAKHWNNLLNKFTKLQKRLVLLSSSSNTAQYKKLVNKLQNIFSKLEKMQYQTGIKVAGTSLAIMLASFTAKAQFQFVGSFTDQVEITIEHPNLVDIDGDGDLDILGTTYSGDFVFQENSGTSEHSYFEPVQTSPFGLSSPFGFYTSTAIADLDNDGDFDLLCGESYGQLKYYENTGSATNPIFGTAQTTPFGLPYLYRLNQPYLADIDNDGDLDFFASDGDSGDFYFAENTGTSAVPAFGAMQTNPFGLTTQGNWGRPSLVDLDNDGDLDMFTADIYGQYYYYENIGTSSVPSFGTQVLNPFNVANQGSGRNDPLFGDIDNDGDLDFVSKVSTQRTQLFENVGTASAPSFEIFSIQNKLGLTTVAGQPKPAFYDLDNDGDLDAIVGYGAGTFEFFENIGSNTNPIYGTPVSSPFGLGDVDGHARPEFCDIDNDGDGDLFVGRITGGSGSIVFYENTGTSTAPSFTAAGWNPLGLTDPGIYSEPAIADIDGDGDFDMLVTTKDGNFSYFPNVGTATAPSFGPLQLNPFGLINTGTNSYPTLSFGDLDGDNDFDLLVALNTSEFRYYENTGSSTSPSFPNYLTDPFGIILKIGGSIGVNFVDIDGDNDLDVFAGNNGTMFFENLATAGILVNSITVQGAGNANTITTAGGTLQIGATVLPANATNGTYTWSVTNGTGSATIDANGLLTAVTDGTVTVTATANDASGETASMVVTISNQSVGVNEASLLTVTMYPNPTTGAVIFSSKESIATIEIYNLTGQKVSQFVNTKTIDISKIPSGIYTATIQTKSGKTALKKLVKE